jgi:PAS domain-containing protein
MPDSPDTPAKSSSSESEARYRMLFDTLIEGFCTIEVIFDAAGKAIDYRFLEINPAFERQSGIQNAQGKRIREIALPAASKMTSIVQKPSIRVSNSIR